MSRILPHASMVPYVLPNVALTLMLMLGSKDMHWIPTHAQTEKGRENLGSLVCLPMFVG
jgi:hypothetical protein